MYKAMLLLLMKYNIIQTTASSGLHSLPLLYMDHIDTGIGAT